MKQALLAIILAGVFPLAVRSQQPAQAERETMYYRYLEFASYVKGGSITPHWMADGSRFWYAEGAPANTVIWKVDPANGGTKTPLFDTGPLRKALTPLLGHEPPYEGLPFGKFTFVDDGEKAAKFTVEGKEFILQLDTYVVTGAPVLSAEERSRMVAQPGEVRSPDGRWFVGVKDYNLWLRSAYDGRSVPLTSDGVKDYEWMVRGWPDRATWSPDGLRLAVKKVDYREVHKIPVVHWLKTAEEIEWVHFPRADGPLPQTELFIVDILSQRQVRVDTGGDPDQYIYILGWLPDGSELLFLQSNRTFKKLDLVVANPATGAAKVVLTETQKTFVRAFQYGWPDVFTLLEDGKRFIWMAERDGWSHLYLYNLDGTLIRRRTQGAFPVVEIVAVHDKAGWVYFTAHGDKQRPYDTHFYRVSLEGKGFTRLTEASGQHEIQFAPSRGFFLDTHSSVNRPPVVELRKADGTLLGTLSKANIDALQGLKWEPPEQFVVKAADGRTDLYGVLYKPYDFNPDRKYPVIEYIAAGPEEAVVPRTFNERIGLRAQAWAQLGFIIFIVDGRGTPERGKEFQDVVYGNIGRHEIPDHVATLKQLAEKRPHMDLSRVGIFGYSWGGHFAIRGLTLAPDVYHVGIAGAPDTDLYYHHPYDVETWMGRPQENKAAYDYGSNLWLADKLKGKLLLIHGTSDINCPFSNTMRMVEALIRAGKPYDLILLPEQGHSATGPSRTYMGEAIRRYFQEHLKP